MAEHRQPVSGPDAGRPAPADDDTESAATVFVPSEYDELGRPVMYVESAADAADHWDARRWRGTPESTGPHMIRPWRFHP